eukprot:snap_masked-scaffold_6-processed-gene-14.35-mRNA-1 protein AED:0.19 eAED:0.19 QI:0/0/0/1/1/1/2/0/409
MASVYEKSNLAAINLHPRKLFFLLIIPNIFLLSKFLQDTSTSTTKLCVSLSILISSCGYFLTTYIIPKVGDKIISKLYGIDICKRGLFLTAERNNLRIPESIGLVSGFVLLLSITIQAFISSFFFQFNFELNATTALSCITFAILLGLSDDVLDIKWKHKILISVFMSFPLLLSYRQLYSEYTTLYVPYVFQFKQQDLDLSSTLGDDVTTVINSMLDFLGVKVHEEENLKLINLGSLFYVYIVLLVVFCTNSINIYAGINGFEVGQTIIISLSIIFMNLMELCAGEASEHTENHLFSLQLSLPFLGTSLALLRHNFYPAKVFVGDVFPYYSGIIVPCPRHRLPKINLETGWLESSKIAEGSSKSNHTLLCLALDIFGPLHERTLCIVLLTFQAFCNSLALFCRYYLFQQ